MHAMLMCGSFFLHPTSLPSTFLDAQLLRHPGRPCLHPLATSVVANTHHGPDHHLRKRFDMAVVVDSAVKDGRGVVVRRGSRLRALPRLGFPSLPHFRLPESSTVCWIGFCKADRHQVEDVPQVVAPQTRLSSRGSPGKAVEPCLDDDISRDAVRNKAAVSSQVLDVVENVPQPSERGSPCVVYWGGIRDRVGYCQQPGYCEVMRVR